MEQTKNDNVQSIVSVAVPKRHAVHADANTYKFKTDSNDTTTTSKSNKLNAERQNAPLCNKNPYAITLIISSTVNIATKP